MPPPHTSSAHADMHVEQIGLSSSMQATRVHSSRLT